MQKLRVIKYRWSQQFQRSGDYASTEHTEVRHHLLVEVNSCLVEGLVDTGASMSVMAAAVVRELGLMHLVSGFEIYKTASGAIT